MKYIFHLICLLCILYPSDTIAQKGKYIKVETIEVQGNCNACKVRIEDAADIRGVKKVVWNKEDNQLSVTYDTRKTSIEEVSQSIADAGHDTNLHTANDSTYHSLPACCSYRSEDSHKH